MSIKVFRCLERKMEIIHECEIDKMCVRTFSQQTMSLKEAPDPPNHKLNFLEVTAQVARLVQQQQNTAQSCTYALRLPFFVLLCDSFFVEARGAYCASLIHNSQKNTSQ